MLSNIRFIAFSIFLSFTLNINAEELNFEAGKWQTIVDGQSGEGAFFYRMEFTDDYSLIVTKQCGGKDNIVENKTWKIDDDFIVVESSAKAQITEFDGRHLKIVNSDTIEYENGLYNSHVKPYFHGFAVIHWILILLVLIGLNELFRRSKISTGVFFILLPLILTPLVWSEQGVTYWFKWVKVYSVVFAVIWFALMRYTKLGNKNWAKFIAAMFLAVNIMEAVSQDFSMGYLPNILNGVAGVFNTITLFYAWKGIVPDCSKHKDLVWPGMTTAWIISYDIWNIVYVYLNFPGSTSAQLMVLLSCTIPALFIKKGTWLQARAFTLAAWFMYYFTFPRHTEQLELLVPRSYNLMLIAGIISITINIYYFIVFVKKVKNNN